MSGVPVRKFVMLVMVDGNAVLKQGLPDLDESRLPKMCFQPTFQV